VPDRTTELRYAINPVAAAEFDVGQAVRVEYQERGIPPLWQRIYVVALSRPE